MQKKMVRSISRWSGKHMFYSYPEQKGEGGVRNTATLWQKRIPSKRLQSSSDWAMPWYHTPNLVSTQSVQAGK